MNLNNIVFSEMRDEVASEVTTAGGGGAPVSSEGTILSPSATPAEVASAPGGPSVVAPAAASISIPDNWKESLSEDLRNDPNMGPITDLPGLAKSFIHAQKMVGSDKFSIPDKHATDDDWRSVFSKIGLPEKIADYEFKVPENSQFEDGFMTQFKEQAFSAGILPRQVEPLLKWYSEANNKALSDLQAQQASETQTELSQLKQEWGQAYDQNVNLAKQAAKATGMENVFDWLNETGLGDNPMMIKMLSKFGSLMKEDTIADSGAQSVHTPGDYQSQITKITGDMAHPYYKADHPGHKTAVAEVSSLYENLYPKKVAPTNSIF